MVWTGPERIETRVPREGTLPDGDGTELATVSVTLAAGFDEPRTVVVRGFRGESQVAIGATRIHPATGTSKRFLVLLHGSLPDRDGDGLPDVVDDVCDGRACGDAGTPGPDAPPPDTAPLDAAGDVLDAVTEAAPPPDTAPDAAPEAAPPFDAGPEAQPDTAPDLPPDGPATLGEGLVGYWKLDEGAGATLADSAGSGLTGTLKGSPPPTWTAAGYRASALEFGNGWMRVAPTPALDRIRTGFTIAAWIFRLANQTGTRVILSRQTSSDPIDEHYTLQLADNKLYMGGAGLGNCYSPAALPVGRWLHVAGTHDGATMRLYVDGAEVRRDGRPGSYALDTTPLTIGGGLNTADQESIEQRLQARVDELVLYSRALAAEEIRALAAGVGPR